MRHVFGLMCPAYGDDQELWKATPARTEGGESTGDGWSTAAHLCALVAAMACCLLMPKSARAGAQLVQHCQSYTVSVGDDVPTPATYCWLEFQPGAPRETHRRRGAGGGGPIGGGGNLHITEPPPLPDTECVTARVDEYGHFKTKPDTEIVYEEKWAFGRIGPDGKIVEYYYSSYSNRAPQGSGWTWVYGWTEYGTGPDTVHIYRGAYSPRWNQNNLNFPYRDPDNGAMRFLDGPLTPDEFLTIVLEHELGHVAGSAKSEAMLTGYGVEALQASRNDPNAASCN